MSIEYQAIVSCNTCGSELHREELAMRSDFVFYPQEFLQGEWNPHITCCEECEDVITVDLASAFLNSDVEGTELANFNSIIDLAAEHLASFQGYLNLDGLTELSDAAAESLSKHKGELGLYGLTELSDAAADSLSQCEGGLDLSGLTELSDSAAERLSKCQNVGIDLDNLPPSAAQILRDAGHGV